MNHRLILFFLIFLVSCSTRPLRAQNPIQVNLFTPAPQGVIGGSGFGTKTSGPPITVFYWVVTRFGSGATGPSAMITVTNTAGFPNFNASNFATISWTGVAGATGYDVVRNTVPAYPVSNSCAACAVVLNTTATQIVDNSSTGLAYPPAGLINAQSVTAVLYLDGATSGIPKMMANMNGVVYQILPEDVSFGPTLPATCSVGSLFFLTTAVAGSNLYGCTSTNTWTLMSGSGSGIASGAALPATCTVGEVFFLTSAVAGLNIYGCTSVNTWTLEGGSSSSGAASVFTVEYVSPTRLRIGPNCTVPSPCVVKIGTTNYLFTAPETLDISAGATAIFVYATSGGTLTVGHNGDTLVCSGVCALQNGITAFPLDSVTIWTWTVTAGTFNVGGGTIQNGLSSTQLVTCGSGITCAPNASGVQLSVAAVTGFTLENAQSSTVTVTGTATETDLLSFTLPANELGNTQQLETTGWGYYSVTGGQTLVQLRMYIGATLVYSTNWTGWSGGLSGGFRATINCSARTALGAAATVDCQGVANLGNATTSGYSIGLAQASTFSIATNASKLIKFTIQWGTADASSMSMTGMRSIRYN